MSIRSATTLIVLMVTAFLVVGQLYVTLPLSGALAARFSVGPASVALAGTAFGLAYAAGFLLFGPLSDRYGRRRIIVAGLVATALATALVGLASRFDLLLLARAAQGLAAAAFPPTALSLVAEMLPDRQRPLGVSAMSFAFLGAAPLAQFLAAWSGLDLATIMLRLAPVYALAAVTLAFLAPAPTAPRTAPGAPTAKTLPAARMTDLFRDPLILAAWGAATTMLFGFVIFHGAIATSGAADPQLIRLVGLPPFLLTFAAAAIIRAKSPGFTARLGLSLSAAGLLIALAPGGLMPASILLSSGLALAVPGFITTIAGRADNANRGLALAIYTFTLFVGASIAPPLAPVLALAGPATLVLIPAALMIAGVLALFAARGAPACSAPTCSAPASS